MSEPILKNAHEPIPFPSETSPENVQLRSGGGTPIWRALLWGEWYAHSRILLVFLALWLVAVWTLPLFTHAGWIMFIGVLYAMFSGPLYGGGDTIEGCEEFTFSLPCTRAQRYIARLIVGGGTLLALCAMNVLALGFDLPQVLAGFYVRGALVSTQPVLKIGLLCALVLVLPLTIFCVAFAIAAITHSRFVVFLSWFWGALGGLSLLQIGFWYENLVYDAVTGNFACALLLIGGAGIVVFGYSRYIQKEVGKAALPMTLPGLWWLWLSLFVVGLGLAAAVISSLLRHVPQLFRV